MKTIEKLRLLLINARSIMQIDKKLEIEALVAFNNYDIICVTESWASPCVSDSELKIEGIQCIEEIGALLGITRVVVC